jgi:hypothetical protein
MTRAREQRPRAPDGTRSIRHAMAWCYLCGDEHGAAECPRRQKGDCICPRGKDSGGDPYDPDCPAHATDRHIWGKEVQRG